MFFGSFSVMLAIGNIFPRALSKRTADGRVLFTDGYYLVKLFRIKYLPSEYGIATEHFNNKQYTESAASLHGVIESGNRNKHVLRLAISANALAKNFEPADRWSTVLLKKYVPNSDDYCQAGYCKSELKLEDE